MSTFDILVFYNCQYTYFKGGFMRRIKRFQGCINCTLLRTCQYSACDNECDQCINRCCFCVADCRKCHLACDNRTADYDHLARNL